MSKIGKITVASMTMTYHVETSDPLNIRDERPPVCTPKRGDDCPFDPSLMVDCITVNKPTRGVSAVKVEYVPRVDPREVQANDPHGKVPVTDGQAKPKGRRRK